MDYVYVLIYLGEKDIIGIYDSETCAAFGLLDYLKEHNKEQWAFFAKGFGFSSIGEFEEDMVMNVKKYLFFFNYEIQPWNVVNNW